MNRIAVVCALVCFIHFSYAAPKGNTTDHHKPVDHKTGNSTQNYAGRPEEIQVLKNEAPPAPKHLDLTLNYTTDELPPDHPPTNAAALRAWLWYDPQDPIKVIPVCWASTVKKNNLNLQYVEETKATIKQWIMETWGKNSAIFFVGWHDCGEVQNGISIGPMTGSRPYSKIGTGSKAKAESMVVPFCKKSDCKSIQAYRNRAWNRGSVVHEFGHALGLIHEQDRKDTPEFCRDQTIGERSENANEATAVWKLTNWDSESIMNYCAENYNGDLTQADISAIQELYGEPDSSMKKPNVKLTPNFDDLSEEGYDAFKVVDTSRNCCYWAKTGYCSKNDFVRASCAYSCGTFKCPYNFVGCSVNVINECQ